MCSEQLRPITGNRCPVCSRLSEGICLDCQDWKNSRPHMNTLDSNYSIYPYTPMIQTIISQWKYRGDYEIGFIFKFIVQQTFQTLLNFDQSVIIIPIPLSEDRLYERAFNQAEVIASWITPEPKLLLTRRDYEKQAKKSKNERITSENPFILPKTINKPVLLVDDIYTTGTTLRHASTVLKESGCPRVDAFTLVRS